MQYVNSIALTGTITVFTPSGAGSIDDPYTYSKSTVSAAIFKKTGYVRDDFKRETRYKNVVLTKDSVSEKALIYLGTTAETDPKEVEALEIKDFSPMETVNQSVIGYKIWL